MLSEEIAIANAEYIAYSSPHTLVRQNEEYIEYMLDWNEDAMDILYPTELGIKTTYYESLQPDTLSLQNSLWEYPVKRGLPQRNHPLPQQGTFW